MPTFECRHPVSGFYPLLPRTDGGGLAVLRTAGREPEARTCIRPTDGTTYSRCGRRFRLRPLPDRSRFLQVRDPFQEEPNSLFRSGPYTGPKQRATRYPPRKHRTRLSRRPVARPSPSLRDVRIRSAIVFRSTKPFGPQPFSRPGGFRPPALPRAREPETGRPFTSRLSPEEPFLPAVPQVFASPGRHPRPHFPTFSFSMEPLAASFCPDLPGAIRLLCRKS